MLEISTAQHLEESSHRGLKTAREIGLKLLRLCMSGNQDKPPPPLAIGSNGKHMLKIFEDGNQIASLQFCCLKTFDPYAHM